MSLGITPREVQILDLVKLGYEDKRVGAELGITPQSVKSHLQLIFAKLQAVNRVDAVIRALRAGYLSLDGMKGQEIREYQLKCKVKIFEPWAKLDDFLQAIERFNKQNEGVAEVHLEETTPEKGE